MGRIAPVETEVIIEDAKANKEIIIENHKIESFRYSDTSLITKESDYDIIMESIEDTDADIILET